MTGAPCSFRQLFEDFQSFLKDRAEILRFTQGMNPIPLPKPTEGTREAWQRLLTYVRYDISLLPSGSGKPLVWMGGKITSPPFSREARIETGLLLRLLQQGGSLGLPHSRPMPNIGPRCHELRVRDETHNWRIFYHLAPKEVVVLALHHKTTPKTPVRVIETCRHRAKLYQLVP